MKSIEDQADRDYGCRVLAAFRARGLSTSQWNYAAIQAMEKSSRLEFLSLFKKHDKLASYALIELIRTATPEALVDRLVAEKTAQAVYASLRAAPPEYGARGLAYFAVFELGRGLVSVFLYAVMRSRVGAGPRTAGAGMAAWVAFSVAGPARFIPLGFYSNALWAKAASLQLVTSIVAALAGAAVYRERPPA
jgi:hypothetical protein